NNTARQVAVALGVAILGSVVSSVYRNEMSEPLGGLPEGARHTAGESIGGTMAVAERMGAAGQDLIAPAHAAFVHAMHTAAVASAVVAFIGALVVLRWMPGKRAADSRAESASSRQREAAGV
ncbi:MFS transporter, partial [Actinomadura sp. HBU206391]|nr:MFS transporter [Actinomadura sp. HBU206391]